MPLPRDRYPVAKLLERWLTDSAARKVRPKTLRRYQELVRLHIVPRVGGISLAKLEPQDVERMMADQIKEGGSPQSAVHSRAVLRRALNVAMRWRLIGRNVASLAEPHQIPEREFQALTPATACGLLEVVQGDRMEALFSVALALRLRQSEALGLQWRDIGLEAGCLTIQRTLQRDNGSFDFFPPKTRRSRRTIPIPRPLAKVDTAHRARQHEERLRLGPAWEGEKWGGLVFANDLGQPLSGFNVSRRFKKLVRIAGLPTMRYHDLRHGAASLMAAQSVPARVAMEILGHTEISTTLNIYTHVAPEFQREALVKVSGALFARN